MSQTTKTEPSIYERAPGALVTHAWRMVYNRWNPEREQLREALCTLGNGYFATRGAAEESRADGVHYPGTYLACGYNRLQSEVAGRMIENEDFVNWPNWLPLSFCHPGEQWFDLAEVELLEYRQTLDIRRGVLQRRIRFRDDRGRESLLQTRRIVHMGDPHLAAIQWTLTPENWSGPIDVRSAIDGSVSNGGVARYKQLNDRHLEVLDVGETDGESIWLQAQTRQSHVRMAQAARTRIVADGAAEEVERRTERARDWIAQAIHCRCEQGEPLCVEKTVAVYTSRDRAISESVHQARKAVGRAGRFCDLLDEHTQQWEQLWRRCNLSLKHDEHEQFVLRLHIFHLLQTASMNTIDLDAGMPSRGLHGEAYRGHILWDELFIFPFYNLRIPELTRTLLLYRWRRLPEARRAAAGAGYQGAMFPWQSGSDGREESQVIHLNPRSGRWVPDNTYRQRHVNAAIAHNVWQYYQATHDTEFLAFHGVELIVEIARFWASISSYNPARDRYEIHGVVGPDEFHTAGPDSEQAGLKNNAYTNVMAAWVLRHARIILDRISGNRRHELLRLLALSEKELERWEEIARKMFVPFHDGNIISQFEGYERLKELDWEGYSAKYGDIQRLDRILEAEGDEVNHYKASKQADVLMLFYLFSTEELEEMFESMGYDFQPIMIPENIDYYLRRTSHGSTLSRVVHSWVLARSDRENSWRLFQQSLETDLADIQGGTTSEGIHLGAMAGTVDIIQRAYSGVEIRGDALWFNPRLPTSFTDLRMRLRYRGHWLNVHITRQRLRISVEESCLPPFRLGFRRKLRDVGPGQAVELELENDH